MAFWGTTSESLKASVNESDLNVAVMGSTA